MRVRVRVRARARTRMRVNDRVRHEGSFRDLMKPQEFYKTKRLWTSHMVGSHAGLMDTHETIKCKTHT